MPPLLAGAGAEALAALRSEFVAAQQRMEALHMEAMDLGADMERTAGKGPLSAACNSRAEAWVKH